MDPNVELSLLAARPVLLGRPSPEAVADFWDTPLLTGDAAKTVKQIVILDPPVRVVVEGQLGPRVQEQHLSIITYAGLRDTPQLPDPISHRWLSGQADLDVTEALIIDYAIAEGDEIMKRLGRLTLPQVGGWSRPMPSPSDKEGRRTIYGYTRLGTAATQFQGHALVRALQAGLGDDFELTVGHSALLNDPAVLIADFTKPAALLEARGLCDQVVMLSPHRAAVLTTRPRETWQNLITTQSSAGDVAISRLSWRRSTRGGNAWVTPHTLTPQQRARARHQ